MLLPTNYCTTDQSHIPYALKANLLKSLNHHFSKNLQTIVMVKKSRYLGITISTKNSDLDLKRKMRNIMLTLIYCSKISLNVLLVQNVIYLRHTVLIYVVYQCGLTALKQF